MQIYIFFRYYMQNNNYYLFGQTFKIMYSFNIVFKSVLKSFKMLR